MCGSFIGNYALSKKQPDLAIQPDDQRLPAVVIESGWSESRHSLEKDRDLWLHGGVGIVQIVIIVEWTKIDGLWVKSDIQVFDLDERGELRLLQEEVGYLLYCCYFTNKLYRSYFQPLIQRLPQNKTYQSRSGNCSEQLYRLESMAMGFFI